MGTENSTVSFWQSRTGEVVAFGAALRQYARVISTLLRRSAVERAHAPLESILALFEPLMMISLVGVARYMFSNYPPYGTSLLLFLSSGFFPYYLFVYVSRRMPRSAVSPLGRYAAEQTLDHIVVHVILRSIDYMILGVVLFSGIYIFVTNDAYPTDIIPILEGCASMIILGFGVGVTNLVIAKITPLWNHVFPTLARILAFFSGIHFVTDFLSPTSRYLVSLNPMMHAITLFRTGFYPQFPRLVLDTRYLAMSCIVSVFIGLVLERALRRYVGRKAH